MIRMQPTTEVKLGDNYFTITHWSPTKVMKNIPRIGRYVAIPLATIGGSIASGAEDLSEALPTALLYLFDQMEQDDLENLFNLILEDVEVNSMGGRINIDEVFQGDFLNLIKLVTEVLKANFADFLKPGAFKDLQAMLGRFGQVHQVNTMGQE